MWNDRVAAIRELLDRGCGKPAQAATDFGIDLDSPFERMLARIDDESRGLQTGAIVNAIAYQDEYNTARANLRSLRKAAEVKKCQLPEPLPTEPRR